ncbi:MAG: 3D domain-containing protein [Heliobacteriaceae bacterium]|nr:3D domain-containing protein [Heliobacteriaceae bacterium]
MSCLKTWPKEWCGILSRWLMLPLIVLLVGQPLICDAVPVNPENLKITKAGPYLPNTSLAWLTRYKTNAPVPAINKLIQDGYRLSAPLEVTATAYDACIQCCGKDDGITKTGVKATAWYTIAVDPTVIPLGTKIFIPALGKVFEAQDTGGKIRGRRVDLFLPDHHMAVAFGRQKLKIYLLAEPDREPITTAVITKPHQTEPPKK